MGNIVLIILWHFSILICTCYTLCFSYPPFVNRQQFLPLFLPPCETAEHGASWGGKGDVPNTWAGVNTYPKSKWPIIHPCTKDFASSSIYPFHLPLINIPLPQTHKSIEEHQEVVWAEQQVIKKSLKISLKFSWLL